MTAIDTLHEILTKCRPRLIVSPPRSCSTALARALLAHSTIDTYLHEPCDLYCHRNAPVRSILERLHDGGLNRSSLLKEMTFQLGDGSVCRHFLRQARPPVLFICRDPRLNIESRIRMVLSDLLGRPEVNGAFRHRVESAIEHKDYRGLDDILTEDLFPLDYTGWRHLARQLDICRSVGIDHVIVKAHTLRSEPQACIGRLCARLGLDFENAMLAWGQSGWKPSKGLPEQGPWYERVAESTGILPEAEPVIPEARLPRRFQDHLPFARRIFEEAVASDQALA